MSFTNLKCAAAGNIGPSFHTSRTSWSLRIAALLWQHGGASRETNFKSKAWEMKRVWLYCWGTACPHIPWFMFCNAGVIPSLKPALGGTWPAWLCGITAWRRLIKLLAAGLMDSTRRNMLCIMNQAQCTAQESADSVTHEGAEVTCESTWGKPADWSTWHKASSPV
jgi:hypothetical protein